MPAVSSTPQANQGVDATPQIPRTGEVSDRHSKACPKQRNLLRNGTVDLLPYQESLYEPHCAAKHLLTNFRLLQGMPLKCHSSKPGTRFCIREMVITWSPLTESNRRPSPYHGDALPTELRGQAFSYLTWGFAPPSGHVRPCTPVVQPGLVAKTKLFGSSVGELTALLGSWRLHLQASNLSPRTIRAYTDDGAMFAAFLAQQGMPTASTEST